MTTLKMLCAMRFCSAVLLIGEAQAGEQEARQQAGPKAAAATKQQSQEARQRPQTAANSEKKPLAAAQSPAAEPAEQEIDGVKLAAIEANLVSYTNHERARYGLPPLAVDKELMETAREQAAWMTRNGSLVHTRRPVAENIAMGQRDSSDALRSWMGSPGHRANILNSGHRRIGVAAFRTGSGTIFWCQQFRR